MSAIEPAGDKIVRNLQEAIEALQRDVSRVELWAGALSTFTKPIPDYGHGQTRFDLSAPAPPRAHAKPETAKARRARAMASNATAVGSVESPDR